LLIVGRRVPVSVSGSSMLPTLSDGDVVLLAPGSAADTGDIVLARHPYKTSVRLIKRVKGKTAEGQLTLAGDNPAESTDSRTFGAVPEKDILGKVVCRLK